MTGTNYYCAGDRCRKTTRHLYVRLESLAYLYCVDCGRRLDVRPEATQGETQRRAS